MTASRETGTFLSCLKKVDPTGAKMIKPLRLPLLPVLSAYALGLILGRFDFPFSFREFSILLLILAAVWILFAGMKRAILGSCTALGIYALLGMLSIQTYLHPQPSLSDVSRFIGMDRVRVQGVVSGSPQQTREGTHLVIRCERVILADRQFLAKGRLLLILEGKNLSCRFGDRLRFWCRLSRPHGFHNPGGFSYERYLAFERIHTIGFLADESACVKIGEGSGNPLLTLVEGWRDRIRAFLEKGCQFPSSTILKALVLGEQGDIPEKIKEDFISIGIAHLLAISGDHLGIVAFLSFSTLIWIMKRSESLLLSIPVKKWAAALTIPAILLYTLIAGGSISVIRATLMVVTFFLSILFGRERNLLHTLALAAALILLFSPPSLFDVSFQLSFLAVFWILYLTPPLWKALEKKEIPLPPASSWSRTMWKYLKLSLLVTAVATFGTLPFVALHFNRLSPIGFVTNLLFVPWVGFLIVPIALIASLLSFISFPPALLLLWINGFLTALLLKAVAFCASIPFSSLYLSTPTVLEIVLFYILLLSLVYLHRRKIYRYLFLGLCLILVFDLAFWNLKGLFEKDLRITWLDVGHGDSMLVEFPGGKKMLVDGGGLADSRFDIGENVVAPFLWKKKIRRIDTLVLTHPDPDHLGGLHFIISHFSIGEFWETGIQVESEGYQALQEALRKRRVRRRLLHRGIPPAEIGGVSISFLNPPEGASFPKGPSPSLNNHSLVLRMRFRKVIMLLTGDIEKEAEWRMIRQGDRLRAHILKVPHHGSLSSSTEPFLREVAPQIAILSVGQRNLGRLPHPEIIRRYQALGTKIYRTDRNGAITISTDGETIKVDPFVGSNSSIDY